MAFTNAQSSSGLCKCQKSSEGTHLVQTFNEHPGWKRFLEISGGSVVAKHHQGQEKEAPLECTFCVPSFEKVCCYFPRKGPISPHLHGALLYLLAVLAYLQ